MCIGCLIAVGSLIAACFSYIGMWLWRRPRWGLAAFCLFLVVWFIAARWFNCAETCN